MERLPPSNDGDDEMKTTIEMAREAGGDDWGLFKDFMPEIERLVALVRTDERADCERVVGIALLGAEMDLAKRVLRAIRARGENT
jgi:hypothetical protein